MNELIQKLAKESGFSGFEALDERMEKFAKLIVRECADIAYREGDNVAYLALHFGVDQ